MKRIALILSADVQRVRWASLAFILGGLLMAVFWVIYTGVHGPTSYDETNILFGRSTLYWSLWLSVPPSGLNALGLILLYTRFFSPANRLARVGYVLALISLMVPAAVDLLVWGGLGPPLFVPVLGLGLILMTLGNLPKQIRYTLRLIGILLVMAFALAVVPLDISNQFGGYRWYGLFAHLLPGLGWIGLGGLLLSVPRQIGLHHHGGGQVAQ